VTAFYQPSTRTRLAHEAAMHRLGGRVVGFADPKMTRAGDFYQESIKDTVHMLEYYGDAIVMRHFQQGAPHEAARWASIPVINAGDGWGEHPTQVLTDLYTVQREHGGIDGRTFLCIGDMRMRTMHSIGYALTQFDAQMIAVAPPELSLTAEFKQELADRNLAVREVDHVAEAIAEADVIYMEPVVQADYTASREERGGEVGTTPENYRVTRALLEKAKPDAIILHSLPRMDELPPTSTRPATPATGRRPTTASSCAWRCSGSCSGRWSSDADPPAGPGPHHHPGVDEGRARHRPRRRARPQAAARARRAARAAARQGARDAVLLLLHAHARQLRGGHGPARRARAVHRVEDHPDRHGDTAKEIGEILGRYNDGIAIRQVDWGVGNGYIRDVAAASRVPVHNMQCDRYHPFQALADLLTIIERKGDPRGLTST
jgi:aspartate carbamoyltransferase catalytic subunit